MKTDRERRPGESLSPATHPLRALAERANGESALCHAASRVARPFILFALIALLAVPAPFTHRREAQLETLRVVHDPARVLVEDLSLLWQEQRAAARGALLSPELAPAYEEMWSLARTQEDQLVERLDGIAATAPPTMRKALHEVKASHTRWARRPAAFFSGTLEEDAYQAAQLAQDRLRMQADDAWERAIDVIVAISEESEAHVEWLTRTQNAVTFALVLAALFAALLVVWLDSQSRALPLARRQRLNAERSARARADVLSHVSHDLRSPLSAITTTCGTLQREGECSDAVRASVDLIYRAASRANGMVTDLLDAARREAGLPLVFDTEPVSLERLVTRVVEELTLNAQGREVRLDVPTGLPDVRANAAKVERVLQNLIGNALKFSAKDVTVSVRRKGGSLEVRVVDQGVGLSSTEQAQLFEPFWQSARAPVSSSARGTGLGLSIVRALVEAHGGEAWVESAPGRGSTFGFTLPLA